jgi:hypothetical protein
MKKTKREYIDRQYSKLFDKLGVFFAFNKKQFDEGLRKAGGFDKTGKYVSMPHGLYCPKKNVEALLKGMDQIKKNWEKERQKVEQIRLKWVGVDNWNRPVWKAPDQKAYYGSVNELFDYEAKEEEVLKKVDIFGLCYFGDHMGCEPMGTEVPDQYYI